MMPLMEASVPALEARSETPPLAAARMRRQLTVESAAKLARLTPDEVTWLEEGRLYRFPRATVRCSPSSSTRPGSASAAVRPGGSPAFRSSPGPAESRCGSWPG